MAWEIPEQLKHEFCATAKHRVAQALAALLPGGVATDAVVQMHTLSGEASMLGYTDLGTAAREAHAAAKTWTAAPNAQNQLACAKLLRTVGHLVPRLEADPP
ncbi:MAG: Hpt domain-containing protein [Kofleriaceae bacterium]|nr:Hpt domain-containing protein [Kofleriaceae bacterium]